MKQAGRASVVTVAGIAGLLALVALYLMSGATPVGIATKFMTALADHDADRLAELTDIGDRSRDELKKDWEFSLNTAGPHYVFRWKLLEATNLTSDSATVKIEVVGHADRYDAQPDTFQLPIVKDAKGEWKVLVKGINRGMFPCMPR